MQALAYEGYFENGKFYSFGKTVQLPEKRRVVITVLEDIQKSNVEQDANSLDTKPNYKCRIGFLDIPPLPSSFFEPLPEEELDAWGL